MRQRELRILGLVLFIGIALSIVPIYASAFLIPLTFGVFLAMLTAPLAGNLERAGIGRGMAALLCTFIVLLAISAVVYLLVIQVNSFSSDFPEIKERSAELSEQISKKIEDITGVTGEEQMRMINDRSDELTSRLEDFITGFLSRLMATLGDLLIVLIYMFLFLLYRDKFSQAILSYTGNYHINDAEQVLKRVNKVVFSYIWGRVQVMILLAIMYIILYTSFGIKHAILITIVGTLLTIIPYLGQFLSGLLPIILMLIYGHDFSDILIFTGFLMVIQMVEGYILEPVIIGSEVELNPLSIIIAIIVGNMVWGMPGMILFVPLLAMFKVVAESTENLKPIAHLLGGDSDNGPSIMEKIKGWFKA